MQPSTKSKIPRVTLYAAFCASAVLVYVGAKKLLESDPLKPYKELPKNAPGSQVAALMKQTEFKRYEPGQPVASCSVEQMEIQKNNQNYHFTGVSNGKVQWKNAQYKFTAASGDWDGYSKQLVLSGKSTLASDKFDLAGESVVYNEATKMFRVPGAVTGTAIGGKLKVMNVGYSMETTELTTGKGEWTGTPGKELLQDTPVANQRTWKIEFASTKAKGDIQTYTTARATDGDIILIAPTATLDRKTDILTATGRVKYFSGKANCIADKIVVYRKEKRAVITGNVTMLVKPKSAESAKPTEDEIAPVVPILPTSITATRPKATTSKESQKQKDEEIRNAKNLREHPLSITAEKIEYWYKKGSRRALISGKPQARQELPEGAWRYGWAPNARYDGEAEVLYLTGAKSKQEVVMKNSLGDLLEAESATLSTKENDDEYSYEKGRLQMTTTDDDDDIPPANNKSVPPPNPGSISGKIGA
jgi:lipopolysaccharide export system protein LptA